MIAGIVLAAGQGHRIGQPKAWLRTAKEGESFFGRACALLAQAGADPVVGVIGSGSQPRARRDASAALLVINPHPESGQLSSLQIGLGAIGESQAEAAIVLPVDVPLVSVATVRALMDRWHESQPPVVRPVNHAGRHGHPVIFSRSLFGALMNADPAVGAKPIVRAHVTPSGDVLTDDEGAFLDVDTAEDYLRAFHRLPEA